VSHDLDELLLCRGSKRRGRRTINCQRILPRDDH
jgi:hypothetical protein